MDEILIVGWLATIASTTSFVPQAWKIIKTRQTYDISIGMYLITVAGFSLWTAYGLLLGAWPLIATNSICLSLSAFILVMKILPRREKDAVANLLDPEAEPGAPYVAGAAAAEPARNRQARGP